jgi:hypothetical protein
VIATTLLATLILAAATPSTPTRIEAEYRVSTNGMVIGRVLETYERDGDRYRIESVTRSEGPLKIFLDDAVTLRSSGRVGPKGLEPEHFEHLRARDASRDVRATFDWKAGQLHSEFRGENRVEPLPAGTQDRISILYQFMNIAAPGDEVRMPMSNGRKVEQYAYRKAGEERLPTPAGDFDTLHYERIVDNASESRAELWLARDRFRLPVRIVLDDPKGFRLDQMLVRLTVR